MKNCCDECGDYINHDWIPEIVSPYNKKLLCLICATEIKERQLDYLRYYPDEGLDFWEEFLTSMEEQA